MKIDEEFKEKIERDLEKEFEIRRKNLEDKIKIIENYDNKTLEKKKYFLKEKKKKVEERKKREVEEKKKKKVEKN